MLTPTPDSNNQSLRLTITNSFRDRVHQLLDWGYQDARHKINFDIDEVSITGFICEAINRRLNDPTNELPWLRDFAVFDDSPIETTNATGRKRVRPDIRFEFTNQRPRPQFLIEAKRLRKSDFTKGDYTGKDGLKCFITGLYGRTWPEAGMLGYLQSDNIGYWKTQLQDDIQKKSSNLSLKGPQYDYTTNQHFLSEWISEHDRPSVGYAIKIYHVLFDCT